MAGGLSDNGDNRQGVFSRLSSSNQEPIKKIHRKNSLNSLIFGCVVEY
jgi:hypothetical protein